MSGVLAWLDAQLDPGLHSACLYGPWSLLVRLGNRHNFVRELAWLETRFSSVKGTAWLSGLHMRPEVSLVLGLDLKLSPISSARLVSRPVTSSRGGQLAPPPQPPIGHPVRSIQIRGDFHVRKNEGRFTRYAPRFFYMSRRYGGRSLVLRLRKRGSCKNCWRVTLVGPQWSC